jgi:predicted transcriptional regulator
MTDPVPSLFDLGVDPESAGRLLPHLDSFVKWELLRFLHDNPLTEAAIEDLARYTGRDETEIKSAARALHSAGLIDQGEGEFGYTYSIAKDERTREMIDHIVEGFIADRLVRLAISSHILKAHKEADRLQQVV